MHNATHMDKEGYRIAVASCARRIAFAACCGGLVLAALAAMALPVSLEGSGFVQSSALAASENGNGRGNGKGKGRENAPGQRMAEDAVDPGAMDTDPAGAMLAESDGTEEAPVALPIAEEAPANTNVIKEIAGLAGEAELSEEEELEAIRNGWGTWRTADGPETVISQ